MRNFFIGLTCLCISFQTLNAQRQITLKGRDLKGSFYFYWGYNRAAYSESDIRFQGSDFDFTVRNTMAKDRQSPFGVNPYLKIDQLTIPQYNYRLGYYINSRYNISVGFDHMKYVMVQDQVAKVSGYIHESNSQYNGNYDNTDVKLAPNFLQFEHTDGLNYINTELNRVTYLAGYGKFEVRGTVGAGAGVMIPRTRAVVLDRQVNDQWHISGLGVSLKTGLNIVYGKHFFLQCEIKGGYINMPDIVIEAHSSDRASQHFDFVQGNVVLGYQFNLSK